MVLTSVNSFVDFQIWLLRKVFTTVGALELLRYLVVLPDVSLEISPAGELHTTEGALSDAGCLAVLVSHVLGESCLPPTCEATHFTAEVFTSMELLSVLPQTGLPIAFKITLTTFVHDCFVERFLVAF